MLRTKKGFTLIELMIVVAIIAIIAAIAIPNLLRARIAANESSAIGSLRTLASAQTTAQQSAVSDLDADGVGEYLNLVDMTNYTPTFVDQQLAAGQKSGYSFVLTLASAGGTSETSWHCGATPITVDTTGVRTFYVDEQGVVRQSDNNGALVVRPAAAGSFPAGFLPVGG